MGFYVNCYVRTQASANLGRGLGESSLEEEEEEPYRPRGGGEVDASYSDPLGPMPERPRTSAGNRGGNQEDEFADEEIGDDLLPE